MAIKKYHVSKNLFDGTLLGGYFTNADFNTSGDESVYKSIKVYLTAGTYTFSWGKNVNSVRLILDGNYSQPAYTNISTQTITSTTDGYIGISFRDTTSSSTAWDNTTPIMLNTGSTALPYEPYGDSFKDWFYREYGTDTDTITSLPKTIIGDGQPISAYTIKGNMSQSGTPTPSNPIYPTECGDKTANLFDINSAYASPITVQNNVATGTSFQFYYQKIQVPTTYAGQTLTFSAHIVRDAQGNRTANVAVKQGDTITNGNVITIEGDSTVTFTADNDTSLFIAYNAGDTIQTTVSNTMLSTGSSPLPYEPYGLYKIPISFGQNTYNIYISEPLRKSLDGSNVYDELSSNGTLTRRVDENGDALATPTTEQVTVPTLTTTGTPEQFNVLTTLAPSEVSLTYHGWHEHEDTKYTTP